MQQVDLSAFVTGLNLRARRAALKLASDPKNKAVAGPSADPRAWAAAPLRYRNPGMGYASGSSCSWWDPEHQLEGPVRLAAASLVACGWVGCGGCQGVNIVAWAPAAVRRRAG
jgi:hypothetical protein